MRTVHKKVANLNLAYGPEENLLFGIWFPFKAEGAAGVL